MSYGSTSKNIYLLTLFVFFSFIIGIINQDIFNWTNIVISIISFYILNILGVWMTLHRYYSHKSFEFKNNFLKFIFTILAVLAARGSPLGWVYLHRNHHAYSDTEKDPHSPKFLGFKILDFNHYKKQENEKMKLFLIKDIMSPIHLFIHKWYIAIIGIFCFTFFLIDPIVFYFSWIIPVLMIQISQSSFNYIGHMYGYKNFNTKDDSKNNIWIFPILLGEAWHNNHHANPLSLSTQCQKYEIDPLQWIIKLIKK